MLLGKPLTVPDIIAILRRRIWLLAIPPIVTLFLALLYTARIADVYQADILIAIDPQRVPDEFVRSTVTLGPERRLDSISVQVLSRTNLERMITELGLYGVASGQRSIDDLVTRMRSSIQVELDRGRAPGATSFHVRFSHEDPKVAAAITQQLGSLFVLQNERDRGALAQATNVFLETQLVESRKQLEAQEQKLERFRQQHGPSLPTQSQGNLQAMQSKQIQQQGQIESLARDRDRKLMLERLYRDALNEPSVAIGRDTQATGDVNARKSYREQLAAARAQLAALELKYTASHPDVVRVRHLVAELEPQAAEEEKLAQRAANAATPTGTEDTGSVADPVRRQRLREMQAEMESLDRQIAFKESEERRVRQEIGQYQSRLDAVPGLESEWVALTRDYDTMQATYADLLKKSENAKVAAALEEQKIGERFRIVDPARVPVRPLGSMRLKINVAGLAAGLVLGFAIAGFLEFQNASFRTEADVFAVLGLPVLATVPLVPTTREAKQQRRRMGLMVAGAAMCVALMAYVGWIHQVWKGLR